MASGKEAIEAWQYIQKFFLTYNEKCVYFPHQRMVSFFWSEPEKYLEDSLRNEVQKHFFCEKIRS